MKKKKDEGSLQRIKLLFDSCVIEKSIDIDFNHSLDGSLKEKYSDFVIDIFYLCAKFFHNESPSSQEIWVWTSPEIALILGDKLATFTTKEVFCGSFKISLGKEFFFSLIKDINFKDKIYIGCGNKVCSVEVKNLVY